jgi:putative transposase
MHKQTHETTAKGWLSLPIIATVSRLLCRELTLQVEYLHAENRILRSKVKNRVIFTESERRTLVDAAIAMGMDLMRKVVTIVKPETILVWQRKLEQQKWDYSDRKTRKPGRPRVGDDIEALVCRMARENGWGYARVQGELKKLGIEMAKSTVANILRRNALTLSPKGKGLTWREFLSRHANVFLCADFFTKEIWTPRGLTTAFVFFAIHLRTRKVVLARATLSPNGNWLKQQIRHIIWECEDQGLRPRFFLRDNDACYPHDLAALLKASGVEEVRNPLHAPDCNAHAERFVLSIKSECLDHLLVCGMSRLQYALDEYVMFYNSHRPHQGIDNRVPASLGKTRQPCRCDLSSKVCGRILRQEFIGGLLKSYQRVA